MGAMHVGLVVNNLKIRNTHPIFVTFFQFWQLLIYGGVFLRYVYLNNNA